MNSYKIYPNVALINKRFINQTAGTWVGHTVRGRIIGVPARARCGTDSYDNAYAPLYRGLTDEGLTRHVDVAVVLRAAHQGAAQRSAAQGRGEGIIIYFTLS